MKKLNRVILTGPTGAIGTALIDSLTGAGVEVYAICRPASARASRLQGNPLVTVVERDISDYASLVGELPETDVFYHFAWEKTTVGGRDDVDCQLKNVAYALDAARLAKACGCKAFVGAGSQAEYGVTDVPLNGKTPAFPESGYGIAKYTAGRLTRLLCGQLGIRHNWVRILSVYGKNDSENTLISYLVRSFQAGEIPKLTKCEQVWDYLNASDAGEAFRAIGERGKDGKIYVLGSGSPRPLREYVEEVRDCVAPTLEIGFGEKEYYPHQPMLLAADIRELTEDTGWKPKKTFREGIREILG